jgi:hypothetical protein
MNRIEFYASDRGERAIYEGAATEELVPVPLTRDGFEALAQVVTKAKDLILDDPVRSLIAGYIHHVPNDTTHFNIGNLADVVYKTLSNNLTYEIDQECKAKAKKALEDYNAANQTNVINLPPRETPGSAQT